MTDVDERGRPLPPLGAGEVDTLVGFLDYHRATLAWKTDGLDAAALATTVGPSTMTLGGLLKHLAWVEDYWFSVRLHGNDPDPLWAAADWASDPDWEWTSAADDSPAELHALWRAACDRSRELVDRALADGALDRQLPATRHDARRPHLRWVLVHMVEEYARHNGHADLLREAVDGATGD
ncbi:DinB family protein [Thalassiella azotivora]